MGRLLEKIERRLAEMERQRKKMRSLCLCDIPTPGPFDSFFWARCRKCGQEISAEQFENRKKGNIHRIWAHT